jgi:hypothetical protein
MPKDEVYSWRLSRSMKAALEELARTRRISLAALLEEAARRVLEEDADPAAEERARARALRCAGSIPGRRPDGSTTVRESVRKRLRRRHDG